MASNNINQQIIIDTVDNTTRGLRSAQNNLNSFDRLVRRVQTTLLGFVGLNIGSGLITGLAQLSDKAVDLDSKIDLVTSSTEEFTYAKSELKRVSLETGSSLEANSILFIRLNEAIKKAGGTTEQTIQLTEVLSKGLKISGASAQESASVIRQFSQAIQSGVLRGEEFNALAENGGRIIRALAESLGVTIGQLRAMSKQGLLTADVVSNGLISQLEILNKEAAAIPLTISRSFENVKTEFLSMLQEFKDGNSAIAKPFQTLADNLREIVNELQAVAVVIASVLAVKLVKSLLASAKAHAVAMKATLAHAKAVKGKTQADLEQDVTVKKLQVTLANAALREKQQTVEKIKQSQTLNRINYEKLRSKQALIATQRQEATTEAQLIALQRQASIVQAALTRNTNIYQQNVAKLTPALSAQASATAKLAMAQKALAASTALANKGAIAQVGFLGKVGNALKFIGGALTGLPALFAFLAYELAKLVGVDVTPIRNFFAFLIMIVKKAAAEVFAFFGLLDDEELAASLQKSEKVFQDTVNNRLGQLDKEIGKIKETNDEKIKSFEEANKLLEEQAKKAEARLEEQSKLIDANVEIEKVALADKLGSKEAYEAAVKQLEANAELLRKELAVKSIEEELERLNTHNESKIKASQEANKKLQDEDLANNTAMKQLKTEYFNGNTELTEEEYKKELNRLIDHQTKIKASIEISNSEITKLNISHLEAQKSLLFKKLNLQKINLDKYVKNAKSAEKEAADALKDTVDFKRKLFGDERASYEQQADATKKYYKIRKKLGEARKAQEAGNFEESKRLNKEAVEESKELAEFYKKQADANKGDYITYNNEIRKSKDALKLVEEGNKQLSDSSKQFAEAQKKNAKSIAEQIDTTKNSIHKLNVEITDLTNALDGKHTLDIDIEDGVVKINDLDTRIKKLNQTVTVKVNYEETGKPPQKRQTGGIIHGYNSGGYIRRKDKVPGSGSGDKVKALLEPGEFVMRKSAVQKYGEDFMYKLNQGKDYIQKFATGGLVNGVQKFATGGAVKFEQTYRKMIEALQDTYLNYKGRNTYIVRDVAKNVIEAAQGKSDELKTNYNDANTIRDYIDYVKRYASKHYRNRTRADVDYAREFTRKINLILGSDFKFFYSSKAKSSSLKFADGGTVPGSGLGDTVRALLTPGEFVMKKNVVQQFGSDFFKSLNNGIMPQRFNTGGMVGATSNSGETITLNFNMGGSAASGVFPNNNDTIGFIEELKRIGAGS